MGRKVRRTWGTQSFELGPPVAARATKIQKAKNMQGKQNKNGETEEKTKLLAPTVLGRWAFCSGFCCGRGICTCSPCLLHLECKRAATIFGPPSRPLLSFSSAIDAWMTICKQIGQIMGIEMGTTIHYIANTAWKSQRLVLATNKNVSMISVLCIQLHFMFLYTTFSIKCVTVFLHKYCTFLIGCIQT